MDWQAFGLRGTFFERVRSEAIVTLIANMDLKAFITEFQDFLAPKLDTYEQAIYLYIFRHTRLLDITEATMGLYASPYR